jgi:multisubunit Na+/H+ antiporter MnhB subunit
VASVEKSNFWGKVKMTKPATSDYVSVSYRYIAAYNEVNARIAQRQHALSIYITLIVGLIAALVASKRAEEPSNLPIEWLLYGFSIASVCLLVLNYKYEQTLTNLRQYLSELERLNNSSMDLPSYNTETRWSAGANKGRRFHDFACALLVAACNSIALGVFYKIYPEHFKPSSFVIWVTVMTTLVSVAALLFMTRFSYKPKLKQR